MHTEHLAKWQTHKSLGMLPWMTRDRRYSRQQVLSPYSPPAAAQSACDASVNIIQAPQQLLLMRILLSSPVYRWGGRGFRKVTKLKTDCTWNCKSIEEEWLLSQELPGCIMNEKTGCTEGKKGVFWKTHRDSEKGSMWWIWWGCLCCPDQRKRATPAFKAEKVKGKSVIFVLTTWPRTAPQPHPLPPARCQQRHATVMRGVVGKHARPGRQPPLLENSASLITQEEHSGQLHSPARSFCTGHLVVINMTITVWKRKHVSGRHIGWLQVSQQQDQNPKC